MGQTFDLSFTLVGVLVYAQKKKPYATDDDTSLSLVRGC